MKSQAKLGFMLVCASIALGAVMVAIQNGQPIRPGIQYTEPAAKEQAQPIQPRFCSNNPVLIHRGAADCKGPK